MSLKVHHLNCATLCPLSGNLVCHCLLIESPKGLILVDTGLGTKDITYKKKRLDFSFRLFVRPKLDVEETALYQIRKLGFKAEEVKHIVITHLHMDHVGGISDFPKATVHVLRGEYNSVFETNKLLEGYNLNQFNHEIDWHIHDIYGEKWNGFNKSNILLGSEDILLVPLRGHTSGHCGVAVNSSEGWLMHCGDAYFHKDTIKKSIESTPKSIRLFQYFIEHNSDTRLKNQLRLAQLFQQQKSNIRLICSHDPSEYHACACGKNPNLL